MKYEKIASQFCQAIRDLAAKEDNLNNLESYLTYNFPEWIHKYANTPEGITCELKEFARMTW